MPWRQTGNRVYKTRRIRRTIQRGRLPKRRAKQGLGGKLFELVHGAPNAGFGCAKIGTESDEGERMQIHTAYRAGWVTSTRARPAYRTNRAAVLSPIALLAERPAQKC